MSIVLNRINDELNENLKLQNDIVFKCAKSGILIPQQELEKEYIIKK